MLTIHDATPAMADGMRDRPVLDRLAQELRATRDTVTWGEGGRTTAYCLEKMAWRGEDNAQVRGLREALAAGLVLAPAAFPVGVDFCTGDSDALLCINEDGTRGAIVRPWRLHPANHRPDYEAEMESLAYREGGGIPDTD